MNDETLQVLLTYTRALSRALGYRDENTRLHSDRVAALADELARACDCDQDQRNALKIAAIFHDVGKVGIPDRILYKPAKFDEDEWESMKRHSEIGEQILLSIEQSDVKVAAQIVRSHHEHFDGSGYPDGLQGDEIPYLARILSIVDGYDAMAVTRSYHAAKDHDDIMAIMRKEVGEKYDPEIFALFERMIPDSLSKTRSH